MGEPFAFHRCGCGSYAPDSDRLGAETPSGQAWPFEQVPLDKHRDFLQVEHSEELLALDEALHRLEKMNSRQSRIVELRYFGGLSVEETAAALGVSPMTVKRDWATARAWLRAELRDSGRPGRR